MSKLQTNLPHAVNQSAEDVFEFTVEDFVERREASEIGEGTGVECRAVDDDVFFELPTDPHQPTLLLTVPRLTFEHRRDRGKRLR